jgi:outer membrane protein assembly factor BamB
MLIERKGFWTSLAILWLAASPLRAQGWTQWGGDARHTSATRVVGQAARHILADVVYDPFAAAEKASPLVEGELLVHYQVPILDGNDVFMEFKGGEYTGIEHWQTQSWSERRLIWRNGRLEKRWAFTSDWKPEPIGNGANGPVFEPVFHAALAGPYLYLPGAGGSVFKLDKLSGRLVARVSPFGPLDPHTYVAGPLTVDAAGNVYYNALKLSATQPWTADVAGAWLVRISPDGTARTATFASLVPGAPSGSQCLGSFGNDQLPWPPSPDAVPPAVPCGSQRPGLNLAPAVAPDGTVYTASVAHLSSSTAYVIAANPDLTPKWATSLRDRFADGCDVLLPPSGSPGGCRAGSHPGVDPAQNRPGAGQILDDSTASPVVAPDGSVFLGVVTRYNWFQGHMVKLSPAGEVVASFPFGWDVTPGLRVHDGTYSLVTKENRYTDVGSYCDVEAFCPADRSASDPASPAGYFVTQLDPALAVEWRWRNANTESCARDRKGRVTCVSDHPEGFELCVNAPAIDGAGNVYANAEDGNLYVLRPDGTLRDQLFLDTALGAAYTPVSLGGNGMIYTQNDGHLFVAGR